MPPKKSTPTKRKAVTLAADADIVLTKCRELRDSLRLKSSAEAASEDEWNISSDDDRSEKEFKDPGKDVKKKGAKTQRISLAELKRATSDGGGGQSIVEVAEMNSTQVVEGIENVAVKIAKQVLAKQVSFLCVVDSWIYNLDIEMYHPIYRASNSRYQVEQHQTKSMFRN